MITAPLLLQIAVVSDQGSPSGGNVNARTVMSVLLAFDPRNARRPVSVLRTRPAPSNASQAWSSTPKTVIVPYLLIICPPRASLTIRCALLLRRTRKRRRTTTTTALRPSSPKGNSASLIGRRWLRCRVNRSSKRNALLIPRFRKSLENLPVAIGSAGVLPMRKLSGQVGRSPR